MFALHPQLEADTFLLGDWPLCRILLMNDVRFPWLILVPMQENIREMTDLEAPDRMQLMQEICLASTVLQDVTGAEKMNVAALGNQVPQLHLHIIARFASDAAWPNPVWGCSEPPRTVLAPETLPGKLATLRQVLSLDISR